MIQPLYYDIGTHHEVAALVRRYCDLIESSGAERPGWLRAVASLLPRLHAAIASINPCDYCVDHLDLVDLDARFDLFAHLRALLDDRDSYWLEFDSDKDGAEGMTGSLADDLTDIYFELKHGLRVLDLDPDFAIASWASGYELHWGQHLRDAERQLAMLGAQDRLGSP